MQAFVSALKSLRKTLAALKPPVPIMPDGHVYKVGHDEPAVIKACCDILDAIPDTQENRYFRLSALRIQAETEGIALVPVPRAFLRRIDDRIEDAGGPSAKARSIALQDVDELILSTLADSYPAAVTQPDLVRLTGKDRETISKRMKWLESKRFVERPEGTKRKGHAITAKGLSAIGRAVEVPH